MKCSAVRLWLLTAASAAEPPAAVQGHLGVCPVCARRRRRLVRLEEEVREPPPSLPPAVRQRLSAQLAARSSPAAPPRRRAGSLPWIAALLLAFVLGWLLGGNRTPTPSDGPRSDDAPRNALTSGEELLLARILECDRRLARTERPAEQLLLLDDMAADLRQEAIRRARRGASEDVVLMADLHQRVVRRGVVGRALALPPTDGARLAEVCERLRSAEDEVNRSLAEIEPSAAALLRPLGVAAHDARSRIDRRQSPGAEPEPEPPTADPGGWRGMLIVLVLEGLQLAEEPDPQRRADSLSELEKIDSLLRRAGQVLAELDRARQADGDPARPAKLTPAEEQRVKELEKTFKDLEKVLKRMRHKPEDKEREKEKEKEKGKDRQHDKQDDR
jgi:hypothetical protein